MNFKHELNHIYSYDIVIALTFLQKIINTFTYFFEDILLISL